MIAGVYTLSEIGRIVAEQRSEFKPTLGDGVASENAKNNKQATKDIRADVERSVAGTRKAKNDRPTNRIADQNRTLLDLNYSTPPSPEFNQRVEALAKGYSSPADMKKHQGEEDESRQGAKDFYDGRKKVADERDKNKKTLQGSGIQSQHWNKEDMGENTVFGESRNIKRLHFKNTVFLTEAQVLKKVPDAYKTDGNRFIMKDRVGNEYLLECHVDDRFGIARVDVVNKYNKNHLNEQLGRMKQLYDYSSEMANGVCGAVERNTRDEKTKELMDAIAADSNR